MTVLMMTEIQSNKITGLAYKSTMLIVFLPKVIPEVRYPPVQYVRF